MTSIKQYTNSPINKIRRKDRKDMRMCKPAQTADFFEDFGFFEEMRRRGDGYLRAQEDATYSPSEDDFLDAFFC